MYTYNNTVWALWDLNPGSPVYETGALTNLAKGPDIKPL